MSQNNALTDYILCRMADIAANRLQVITRNKDHGGTQFTPSDIIIGIEATRECYLYSGDNFEYLELMI